jgi:class 3 adenylate cyclase
VVNGREALDAVREQAFDVVLLDIVMPELDGIEVLERLKADPVLQHIPVIMISAVDEIDSVVRCIEMGSEDYLPKPFNHLLLRARVTGAIARKRCQEFERERVRDLFSRFVPEQIVDDVLERTDDDLRLGGSRGVGTVMFTDIRGFTTFSETAEPDRVIDVLNAYFTEMIDAIFEHGGTLVGYRGDGLIAVFGAPLPLDDHADRALASAREMLAVRLPRFNRWAHESGLRDDFKIGIGLNSGPFMSGNVGSARRLEYTVHGDTVNTASRIESMTKAAGQPILVADSTQKSLHSQPDDLAYVGELKVRGRQSTINAWTLAGTAVPSAEHPPAR